MVLLHDIIQRLRLPDDDGGLMRLVVMVDRCRVTSALINRDLFA